MDPPSNAPTLPPSYGEPPSGAPAVLALSSPRPGVPGATWEAALTEIYLSEYRSLVGLAVLLLGDVPTAEDVVQDTFIATHAGWQRLRDREKALPYLRRAVVNRARSTLRHRAMVDKKASKHLPDEPSAEAGAITMLERSAVIDALRGLPERQREALVLRYYADLPEAEIAKTMGVSKGTVKAHTSRAMAALKSVLEPELRPGGLGKGHV